MIRSLSLFCLLLFIPLSGLAQNFYSISLAGGYKYTEAPGAGFDGSINLGISNFYISVKPLNVNFVSQDKYETYDVGSWNFCVDNQETAVADPSNCDDYKKVYSYGMDFNYLLQTQSLMLALGAGYQVGAIQTPYLNVDVIFDNEPWTGGHYWYGNVSAGRQMISVGVGISFNL